ncbi:DUF4232 domain-containing protein [Micromonospora noduli]|uniref:DUF4232 domain-containing protein n=1 Tax=Micromonospora noduli TaxID=709876 RepID=A0A328N3K6_9ACTN|nr:DUF4232 domain-containing protein [Micromonospora noduli]KAB1927264.1 DUF4232 domain-containing protein [Micromonospora noduli]RAN96101.1 hypothetical protein LAH08_04843 [Micromonospora noduli]RAO16666.1 hypothetical protein MED15_03714 [Micromonospora noduli]RAO23833.1 hypothetical protein LUPAC07_00235 [Micromonospora noduli]RAO32361.1 hypothetical protein ONO23_03258 [Micromonospora noduli]
MSDLHRAPGEPAPFEERLADLAGSAAAVARPESPAAVRRRAGHRTARRRLGTGALAVAVLGAIAVGGAWRSSFDDAVPPAVTPSPVTPPSTPAPTTPSPTVQSPTTGSPEVPSSAAGTVGARPPGAPDSTPGRCTTAQLTVTLASEDAASGHRSVAVVFRNSGGATCRLTGYPGVDALGGDGRTLAHAERTRRGYMGGPAGTGRPPTVTLHPGRSASALVEASGFRADGAACKPYVSLLITPPDDVRSVRLRWETDSCSDLEVHPLVAGTTGRSA